MSRSANLVQGNSFTNAGFSAHIGVIFVPKADAILETGSSTRALGMWLWGFVQGKSKALHNFGVVLVHRYICPRESCSTVAQLYLINLLCPIQ